MEYSTFSGGPQAKKARLLPLYALNLIALVLAAMSIGNRLTAIRAEKSETIFQASSIVLEMSIPEDWS